MGELDFATREQTQKESEHRSAYVAQDKSVELGGWTVLRYLLPEFTIAPSLHSGSSNHGHSGHQRIFLTDYHVLGTVLATENIKQNSAPECAYI